jgi:hypothetical protein
LNISANQKEQPSIGLEISSKRAVTALFICDALSLTDADLIQNISDVDILSLSIRALFPAVIDLRTFISFLNAI